MAITFVGVGTIVRGTGALTPTAPSHIANDTLLYCSGSNGASDTTSTPGGWTQLSSSNNGAQASAFALYDTTGSASIPSVTWSASNATWAFIAAFRGIDSGLATCIAPQDRAVSATRDMNLPAVTRTPSVDGSIVFALAHKKKDATSDGTSWGAPSSFTTPGTVSVPLTSAPAGGTDGAVLAYWIQTTATLITSGGVMTGTVTNTTAFSAQAFLFGLQPVSLIPPPTNVIPSRLIFILP